MSNPGEVGSRVSPDLIKQLETRQNAYRSNNKSREQQLFINSNTAWIKLRSSVNKADEGEFANLDSAILNKEDAYSIKHSSFAAQQNVLMGGTRSTNDSPYGRERAGISRDGNTFDATTAYQNYSGEYGLGYRPMPGITGVNIKSKGTYGVTMEAEISIKVFALEDLDAIELLYFRPGYTALLEWGHSVFLDNDGFFVQASTTGMSDTDWFSKSDEKTINEKILLKRSDYAGNYDGMYGYITNFSFEYQEDGSYDCTVKILSKGVILEGLQPTKSSDVNEDSEDEKEDKPEEDKSAYHFLNKYLAEGASRGKLTLKEHLARNTKKTQKISNLITNAGNFIYSAANPTGAYLTNENIPVYTTFMEMEDDDSFWGKDKEFYLQFLHLGDWLRIINSINTITDPRKSNEDKAKEYMFDASPGNKYTTHPDHFSCDPIVAYPTLKPAGRNGSDERMSLAWFSAPQSENDILKDAIGFYDGPAFSNTDLHKDWSEHVKNNLDRYGGTDDVLSIPISFYCFIQEIDALLDSENDKISMFDVLTNVLDKVSNALGGIVDLDLFYNYNLEKYQVIDRNNRIPAGLPIINLTGLGSIASNVKISSTISSNIATQISIAAQGNSANSKDNLAVMMEWNRGAIDRHKPIKFTSTSDNEEEDKNRRKKFLKNLKKLYYQFQNRGIFRDHKYDPGLVSNISVEAHTRNAELLNISRLAQDKPSPPTGVVPVELSFDIQGIHGFVIGTTFKINKGFLPPKYDNFAYIITGISHSIQDNKWVTSVKTQFFPDRSPQKVEPLRLTQSAAVVSAEQQAQLAVSQPVLDEIVLNDPAPIINPNEIGGDAENGYRLSPVWNNIIFKGQRNGLMDEKNPQVLVFIGETKGANKLYINPATGSPEYMLHPDAAAAWFKWRDEMIAKGVPYRVSSAYRSQRQQAGIAGGRTVAKPGRSAHGVGGALDFQNLYRLVGGTGDPKVNLEQGRKTGDYKQLAEIGAKYNWYNPWRLSDNRGTDECWHFEYWGPVKRV